MAIRSSGTKKSTSRRFALRLENLEPRCMLSATMDLPPRTVATADPVAVHSHWQPIVDMTEVGPIESACPDESASETDVANDNGGEVDVRIANSNVAADCEPTNVAGMDIDSDGDECIQAAAADESIGACDVSVPDKGQATERDCPQSDGTFIECLDPALVGNGEQAPPAEDAGADVPDTGVVYPINFSLGGNVDTTNNVDTTDSPSPQPDDGGVDGEVYDAPGHGVDGPMVYSLGGGAFDRNTTPTVTPADTSSSQHADPGNGTNGTQQVNPRRVGWNQLGGHSFEQAIQAMIATIDRGNEGSNNSAPASTENPATQFQPRLFSDPIDIVVHEFGELSFSGGFFKHPRHVWSGLNR